MTAPVGPPGLRDFWNLRYGDDLEFVYGTAPDSFLVEASRRFAAGSAILSLAEGGRRNAVWLARQGHRVTAVDVSDVGLRKARQLAEQAGVRIETAVADATAPDPRPSRRDAIVSIFLHLPAVTGARMDRPARRRRRRRADDRLPPAGGPQRLRAREIPESTIVAMFMNNRAVAAMVQGRLDDGHGWARAAPRHGPGFSRDLQHVGPGDTVGGFASPAGRGGATGLRRINASGSTTATVNARRSDAGACRRSGAMKTTWVMLADGGAARLFDASRGAESMAEIESMVHPEGRMPARALTSDLPGRTFDSAGPGRHAMESEVGPREQAARAFAGLIASRLDVARRRGEVQRIVVAAAPAFLGLLRKAMTAETRQIVVQEFDRDWVKLPLDEVRRRLGDALQAAER